MAPRAQRVRVVPRLGHREPHDGYVAHHVEDADHPDGRALRRRVRTPDPVTAQPVVQKLLPPP